MAESGISFDDSTKSFKIKHIMKTSRNIQPLLIAIIIMQSVFIFMSFTAKEEKTEEDAVQSYRIERKYYDGRYFYVLISNGEARAFL